MIAMRGRRMLMATALLSALALTGCGVQGDEGEPGASNTPPPTSSAPTTPTPSGTPEPSATTSPEPSAQLGTPIAMACNDVLSLQAVYDFNPNYGNDPAYAAQPGSAAAAAIARGGFACGWVNQTSGATFELAVSHPSDHEEDELEDAAKARGTEFDLDEADAWFAVVDGRGTAWIEVDDLWAVLSSTEFGSPADVAGLAQAAVDVLDRYDD